MHHDLDLAHSGRNRDAVHPEELEVCFDILPNHIRVSINDVVVARARSDQRVLALQGVRMLVICGREDASVGDDERSQHPLMVRHDTSVLRHQREGGSVVRNGHKVSIDLIAARRQLLGCESSHHSLGQSDDTVLLHLLVQKLIFCRVFRDQRHSRSIFNELPAQVIQVVPQLVPSLDVGRKWLLCGCLNHLN